MLAPFGIPINDAWARLGGEVPVLNTPFTIFSHGGNDRSQQALQALRFNKDQHTKDALIAAAVFSAIFVGLIALDAFEAFFAFSRAHEAWELDEILLAVPALASALTWFAARRWRQVQRLNHDLQSSVRDLERVRSALETARDRAEAGNLAKSEFLAVMSHETRTPLNAVMGMADIMLLTELSREQRGYVNTIKSSGESLLHMLDNVLELSRLEAERAALETTDFDLREMLAGIAEHTIPQASAKQLDFSCDVAPGVPVWIRGDKGRLQQILHNLIDNAVKFTDRGTVSIAVRATEAHRDRTRCRFEVTDTGIGIRDDDRDRMFWRFTQLDSSSTRRFGGAGLGLAIVKELADLMGAKVGVDSVPDEGSTFWFELDLDHAEPDAGAVGESGATDATAAPQALRVLLAEDDPVNAEIAALILRELGHRVDVVGTGDDAVAAVTERPYDIVLMDINMPGANGVTATRRIRSPFRRPCTNPDHRVYRPRDGGRPRAVACGRARRLHRQTG